MRSDVVRVEYLKPFDGAEQGDVAAMAMWQAKILASAGVVQILTGKKNGR